MKRRITKGISLLLAVMMVAGVFQPMAANALTSDTQAIDVEYETPSKLLAVEQQEKQLIFSTETKSGKVNNFFLSFPADGGVRFSADEKGIFNPDKMSKIAYSGEESYKGEKAVILQANDTKVKFYHASKPWRLEVFNAEDEMVVSYDADHIWMGYDDTKALRKVKISSAIAEDETLFGLGERFNGFVQNGKEVEMWNIDCLSQLSKSYGDHNVGYKNIPMLHSNKGYTVFHNNTYYGIVNVGKTDAEVCSFEFYGPILDMYVWTGSSLENINQYHKLTGAAVETPKWALSYWAGQSSSVWRSNGSEPDTIRETVYSRLDRYDELNTPIKNIYAEGIAAKIKYLDIVDELQERGLHVFGWMDSTYRSHDDDVTAGAIANEALGKEDDDRPLVQWNDSKRASWWTSDGAKWVDYTQEDAIKWIKQRFSNYFETGLNGMMVDYNDKITVDAYYPGNGGTGDWMHNFSCYYYNKAVNEAFKEYYGEGEYLNFARAGCAGSQAFTATFAGDQTADFMGLQQVVSALLSSASSGIHIWGSDIGGMHKSSTAADYDPDLYARWLAFGTFSPLMRTHAQRGFIDPWEYDRNGQSVELFQKYYWTRENIVDLVYSGTLKAHLENIPMTQAMVIAYPEQTELAANNTQYIFCDQLLVCPVTTEKTSSISVQFPEGRWVDFWDGTVYEGGQTVVVNATMEKIPVYIKEGGAFPVVYGEDLDIGTINTVDKNVNALIVAPTTEKVENTYYVDEETTQTVVCDAKDKDTYTVSVEKAIDKKIVTTMGAVADKVTVDGKELKELSQKPTSAAKELGFYRDIENNATIIVTDGSWKEIEYNDTQVRKINYALKTTVSAEGVSEKESANVQNVTDGSYETALSLTEKSTVMVDLGEVREIDKILVAWSGSYARSYVLEISEDGEKWTEAYTKKKGGGGTDEILLEDTVKCRYIRLSDFEKQGRRNPALAEIEVYGQGTYYAPDGHPDFSPKTEEKDLASNLLKNPFVIGGVALVVVLAIATVVILVIKGKKKRKSQEVKENE